MALQDLLNKRNNAEQTEQTADIPAQEKLSASEFINNLVQPIIDLQADVNDIKQRAVYAIRQGTTTYTPENNVITLPGADTQVMVVADLATDTVVSTDGQISLGIRATSTSGGNNTGEVVIVQVMVAAVGSTDWTLGGTFQLNTRSYSSEVFDTIDLTQYVGAGNHNVQLVATGQRTGVTGYSDIFTVILTNMYLVCQTNYQTPMVATGQTQMRISYQVFGTVRKDLHIIVHGSVSNMEVTHTLEADVDSVTRMYSFDESAAYGILTHGVHTVEAWLTCSDGQGGTLESPHLVNRFMVVNENTDGADLLKPYILLQNIKTEATNFVQTSLCDYAVYSPKYETDGDTGQRIIVNEGANINLTFLLTAYAEDYLDEHPEEYFRIEHSCQPGVTNTLNTTVEIEDADGAVESQFFDAYLRVYRTDGEGVMTDILESSQGVDSIHVRVDNSDSFAPTAGSSFLINPKVRNNSEANPFRILNARRNNVEVESVWTNFGGITDGWVTNESDGQKVLRIMAGSRLNIKYNPFAQFLTTPDSAMTIELDFAARNVTDEESPVIALAETIQATGATLGLVIRPIEGALFSASNTVESECDFRWQEDTRTHIAINIHNAVAPASNDYLRPGTDSDLDTAATKIALVRVFINGGIEREMKFSISNRNEFCTGAMSNGGFMLGSDGADIDIYSIRVYESRQLEATDIAQKDYPSTMPSAEAKREFRRLNNIMSSGKIDIEKVKAIGKRCLVWHGEEPYYYASDAQLGWYEIFQYNADGSLNRDLSGTICRDSKKLKATRQGSTANTYYYSNLQTKLGDVKDTIVIPLSMLHPSITVGEITMVEEDGEETGEMTIALYGGNLGDRFPVRNIAKQYPYTEENGIGYVEVPDGWIDGNNLYRGPYYTVADGIPLAQKLVLKINYASAMQSHLAGCTKAYNLLHTAVVGRNSMQEQVSGAMVAKYTEPVLFFVQAEGSQTPVYRGLGTFGAGKMDKPTWGYVKKEHPMFMFIEGSDNNYDLTDFRVPWDHNITYSPNDEGWFYNGLQQFDFSGGATDEDGNGDEWPKPALESRLKETVNWVYMHSPMISYFTGTFAEFKADPASQNTTRKYWCTQGPEAYRLKRYDFINAEWVDAGLEIETHTPGTDSGGNAIDVVTYAYEVIDIRTWEVTAATYSASTNQSSFAALNREIIAAVVAHAKKYIGFYFKPKSLRFHYAFINHLMAGTDNCSKNTYYACDPKAVSVTIDGETRECYLFEMHQDDVDTIGPTDNNGRSTKPYYIDRMHPYSDKDVNHTTSLYEGNNNALFNLIEAMYEETRELQSTLREIFSAMSSFVSAQDTLIDFTGSASVSVWGFFYKYFFATQQYFPIVAYNEQARIRYEYPAMINYTSRGPGARGIAPITQSVGPSLQAEIQYYKRRLVYMASYAAWGNFYDGGKTNNIGISETADSFSLQVFHLPDSATSASTYRFTVTPHQYIYPTGMMGQTPVDPHTRVAPGETFVLNLGTTTSNDTGMSILGINFYRSIGNIGDISTSPNLSVTINGKRLTEFIAEPTRWYQDIDTGEMVPAFRPGSLRITATRLQRFSINGCSGIGGTLDTSGLTRLQELDIRGTNIYSVMYPQSTSLEEIYLGSKITAVELSNLPNLSEFGMDSYDALTSLVVGENVGSFDSQQFATGLYQAKVVNATQDTAALTALTLKDVAWTDTPADLIVWLMTVPSLQLTGHIDVLEVGSFPAITFAIKSAMIEAWGSPEETVSSAYLTSRFDMGEDVGYLSITYVMRSLSNYLSAIAIQGEVYTHSVGAYRYALVNVGTYCNAFSKIEWEVALAQGSTAAATMNPDTGVLTVERLALWEENMATVSATITASDGVTILPYTKPVGLFDRSAKLGDLVYADGSYNEPAADDGTKTVVGVCFYVAPRNVQGEIISGLHNPNDKQQRLMIQAERMTTVQSGSNVNGSPITLGGNNGCQWGVYSSTSDAATGLYYTDSEQTKKLFDYEDQGLTTTSFYNIPTITDLGTLGLTTPGGTTNSYATDDTMRDATDDENNQFKRYSAGVAAGDGFAVSETEAQVTARTLDRELAMLAGNGYHEGDIVNSGYAKTLRIIQHRNKLLNRFWPEIGLPSASMGVPTATDNTTELQDLVNGMAFIREWIRLNYDSTNYVKWSQIYFPAASLCYGYQPSVRSDETLADKFKAHNWFLPTEGQLARLYWYYAKGTSSDLNIFKGAIAKGKFTNFSTSTHWSSTEYSTYYSWVVLFSSGYCNSNHKCTTGYVVRAVAAF